MPDRLIGQLLKAIEGLPDELRQPMLLTLVERKSALEVSERLGVEVEEVQRRVGEATEILARTLDVEDLAKRLK